MYAFKLTDRQDRRTDFSTDGRTERNYTNRKSNVQSHTKVRAYRWTDRWPKEHVDRQYRNWWTDRRIETYTKLYNYIRKDGRIDDQIKGQTDKLFN